MNIYELPDFLNKDLRELASKIGVTPAFLVEEAVSIYIAEKKALMDT